MDFKQNFSRIFSYLNSSGTTKNFFYYFRELPKQSGVYNAIIFNKIFIFRLNKIKNNFTTKTKAPSTNPSN